MKIVLFLGYSGSGKTTTMCRLVRTFKRRGRAVAAIKHIHKDGLDLDKKGKDTWLLTNSGASPVIAISSDELHIIRRTNTSRLNLEKLLLILQSDHIDYLFIEGWHKKVGKSKIVKKILCANSLEEVDDLLAQHPKPAAIVGRLGIRSIQGVPVYKMPQDIDKIVVSIA